MAEIRPDEMMAVSIAQIRAVLRGMGWEIVASDTRGTDILVTISKPKPPARPTQEERRP